MKTSKALMYLSNYPIPMPVIENIMEEQGMDSSTSEADGETRSSVRFRRCKAQVYLFLSKAPNVTQGGITYSFGQKEREAFARMANAILQEVGDNAEAEIEVGYYGEDF